MSTKNETQREQLMSMSIDELKPLYKDAAGLPPGTDMPSGILKSEIVDAIIRHEKEGQ